MATSNARIQFSTADEQVWEQINPQLKEGELVLIKKESGKYKMHVGGGGGTSFLNSVLIWDEDEAQRLAEAVSNNATIAEQSITETKANADDARLSKNAAANSASSAEQSMNAANLSANAAEQSKNDAEASAEAAATSKHHAELNRNLAEQSAQNAQNSASQAKTAASAAVGAANSASQSEANAINAKNAAANSASSAQSSATEAANSAELAATFNPAEYVKSVTYSGQTVTVTKGDGNTNSFKTKDTTYSLVTNVAHGLMSLMDKKKLDDIADGANIGITSAIESSSLNNTGTWWVKFYGGLIIQGGFIQGGNVNNFHDFPVSFSTCLHVSAMWVGETWNYPLIIKEYNAKRFKLGTGSNWDSSAKVCWFAIGI